MDDDMDLLGFDATVEGMDSSGKSRGEGALRLCDEDGYELTIQNVSFDVLNSLALGDRVYIAINKV